MNLREESTATRTTEEWSRIWKQGICISYCDKYKLSVSRTCNLRVVKKTVGILKIHCLYNWYFIFFWGGVLILKNSSCILKCIKLQQIILAEWSSFKRYDN